MAQIFGASEFDLADAALAIRDEELEQFRHEVYIQKIGTKGLHAAADRGAQYGEDQWRRVEKAELEAINKVLRADGFDACVSSMQSAPVTPGISCSPATSSPFSTTPKGTPIFDAG